MRHKPMVQRALDMLVREAVMDCINTTSLSFDSYVARLTDHYRAKVPKPQQSFNFSEGDDVYENVRKASKKLARYFSVNTTLKLPAVLVPSMVNALPDPWRASTITAIQELLKPTLGNPTNDNPQQVIASLMEDSHSAIDAFLAVSWNGLESHSSDELRGARLELAHLIDKARDALGSIDKELENRPADLKVKVA